MADTEETQNNEQIKVVTIGGGKIKWD